MAIGQCSEIFHAYKKEKKLYTLFFYAIKLGGVLPLKTSITLFTAVLPIR